MTQWTPPILGSLSLLWILAFLPAQTSAEVNWQPSANPLKEPLALITRAQTAFAKVDDYQCQFIKRERIKGDLGAHQIINLAIRKKPFSVSMEWKEPKKYTGQHALYVETLNKSKMRVRASGLLSSLGFLTVAIDDPRVMKTTKHKIVDVGIGHLIDACSKGWAEEAQWGQTHVRSATYKFANRKCRRVELIHPRKADGKFLFFRNVVYFDLKNHLPIRIENYDWPTTTGEKGDLVEEFSYVNLRLNVGLTEQHFKR